jgi:enoyl-CoA hydratase
LAAEIVLLGRHITAQEALEWGLVNRLVPKGQALAEALTIAEQLGETGPLALKAITKSLRDLQTDVSEPEAMLKSDELAGPVFASTDAKEGMRAFKEKRKAVFTG